MGRITPTALLTHLDDNWSSGYQECGLAGKTGASASGLGATTAYYYKININAAGVVEYSITTGATTTFAEIIALMNAQSTGAVFEIVGGDLRCRTITTGAPSTIALSAGTTGTDLFAALTGFVDFDVAVVGVISKPIFIDQFENEVIKASHELGANWGNVDYTPQSCGADEERNYLTVQINEDTLENLLLSWDHARDLIKAKSIAGGWYHIPTANPIKVGNYYIVFLTITEIRGLV